MKNRYFQILKWTAIRLLLRIILMPFTMHGQDVTFINYFPMMFANEALVYFLLTFLIGYLDFDRRVLPFEKSVEYLRQVIKGEFAPPIGDKV